MSYFAFGGFPSMGSFLGGFGGSYMRPSFAQPMGYSNTMSNPMYSSMVSMPTATPAATKSSGAGPPAGPSIYSSMVSVPASNSMYSSQVAAPSIYASMPSVPSVGASAPKASRAAAAAPAPETVSEDYPSLPEGFSTVGIMLWPDSSGDHLLVTGLLEGHSAENCGLEIGDEIAKIDDVSVVGMHASDVALKIAGPTGSSVSITTMRASKSGDGKTTHTVTIVRDVASETANTKTRESIAATNQPKQVPMTPQECMMYGCPIGTTWGGPTPVKTTPALKAARKPVHKPARPAAAEAPQRQPVPSSASKPAGDAQGRLLTHQECMMYGVPYGSRLVQPKSAA